MATQCTWCEGVGITEAELKPGTLVMVATGRARTSPGPCCIALATVVGPTGRPGRHWLDVHFPSGDLQQEYHQNEILGIPITGLTMPQLPQMGENGTTAVAAANAT